MSFVASPRDAAPAARAPARRAGDTRTRWQRARDALVSTVTLPHLSADELDAFRTAQAEARMPLVVPIVVGGVLMIGGFIGWDLMRDQGHLGLAAIVRLGGGAALLALLALVRLLWRPTYRVQAIVLYCGFFLWQAAIGYALGPSSPLQLPGLLLITFFSVLALPRAADSLVNVPLAVLAVRVALPPHATLADITYAGGHFATVLLLVWSATALIERMSAQSFVYRRRLQREASIDSLTGLANRREFEQVMAREMERARRLGLPLMLAIVDIDFFKKVNDRHGHDAGDALLRAVARTMASSIRRSDVLARIGGEEFALVLLGTEPVGAHVVLERLRSSVAAQSLVHGETTIACTISVGVAEWRRGEGEWAAVYRRADRALYRAKAEGRDRVVEARADEDG